MKVIIALLMLTSLNILAQDNIVKGQSQQFSNNVSLTPYKVFFKRDSKQYSIELPFQMSDQAIKKVISTADTNDLQGFMEELEKLYRTHITGGVRDKYFDGSVKQWQQLEDSEREHFEKEILPTLKEYYAPLKPISLTKIIEMSLMQSQKGQSDCNCVDFSGVQIKSCPDKE